jgi:hypothetical protein
MALQDTWQSRKKKLDLCIDSFKRKKRMYAGIGRIGNGDYTLAGGKWMNIQSKREREKKTVSLMIELYCKKNHGKNGCLCPECTALNEYARLRSDKCPFMETKTFCSNCKVHCYKPEMREKIREVMRFSGPRMIFHHPIMAIRHLIESRKSEFM